MADNLSTFVAAAGILAALADPCPAQTVSWADFASALPVAGTPTTVPLGGGTTVVVTVATGGTQGISAGALGGLGTAETGLAYCSLRTLGIFNGGGTMSVSTTLTFSSFAVSAGHLRGFLMVGALAGISGPITVTSSVQGAVQNWTQVGSTFALGPNNSSPIAWSAGTGTFSTTATIGNDSRGIVVDIGALAAAGTITVSLMQHLDDGVQFSVGEEISGSAFVTSGVGCPTTSPPTLALLGLPCIGTTVTLQADNLPFDTTLAVTVAGLSRANVPLANLGAPGCTLFVNTLLTALMNVSVPAATWTFAIPNDPGVVGIVFELQAGAWSASSNPLGLALSDLGTMRIAM